MLFRSKRLVGSAGGRFLQHPLEVLPGVGGGTLCHLLGGAGRAEERRVGDERRSRLDPLAEEELYQSYNELLGGRTMIFVSHRLSSTRFCDRILFLESGQIAEQGTFEALMEQKGKYAEMFHSQAKYYAGSTYGEAEEHE